MTVTVIDINDVLEDAEVSPEKIIDSKVTEDGELSIQHGE